MPKIKTKSGAKKRFKVTGDRQGPLRAVAQAPRHDQAHQEADPPVARHQRAVQDRRRQHQKVLSAERLTASPPATSVHVRSFAIFKGDQPWHASNAASPPMPSTRKCSRPPRAITAGARTRSASPSRRWRRRTNTPIATASGASARSARCGSSASTPRCGRSASTTAGSSPAGQGRHHGRPQGAVGPRHPRAGGVRGDRRPGQGGARVGGVSPSPSWPGLSGHPRDLRRRRRGCPGQARP